MLHFYCLHFVIPAKAGIYLHVILGDPRLRGDDNWGKDGVRTVHEEKIKSTA